MSCELNPPRGKPRGMFSLWGELGSTLRMTTLGYTLANPAARAALALPTGRTYGGCGSSPVENALAYAVQTMVSHILVIRVT